MLEAIPEAPVLWLSACRHGDCELLAPVFLIAIAIVAIVPVWVLLRCLVRWLAGWMRRRQLSVTLAPGDPSARRCRARRGTVARMLELLDHGEDYLDNPLGIATGDGREWEVASVYADDDGKIWIDIEPAVETSRCPAPAAPRPERD